jgi:hypothetical protein
MICYINTYQICYLGQVLLQAQEEEAGPAGA